MGYIPGEEDIDTSRDSSREDAELIKEVFSQLMILGTKSKHLYGSTRFDTYGYVAGFDEVPDISVLQVQYPEIEFKLTPEPTELTFHPDDQFGDDITVAYRIKGSRGWHLG